MISTRGFILSGSLLAVALAALASPIASPCPDGLERVAATHGIAGTASPAWSGSPITDYRMPGVGHAGIATGLAGIAGTILVLGLGLGLGRLVARRPKAP